MASQSVVQLGLLMALPMITEIALERGFITAAKDLVIMQLQLALYSLLSPWGPRPITFVAQFYMVGLHTELLGVDLLCDMRSLLRITECTQEAISQKGLKC